MLNRNAVGVALIVMFLVAVPATPVVASSLTFMASNINILQAKRIGGPHLLEPSIVVAEGGVLYVAAHSAAAERTPVFFSNDDGTTWSYLLHASEFPGAEGTMTVDHDGHAWLFDNGYTSGTMTLYKWCGNGHTACGVIPDAWGHPVAPCEFPPGATPLTDSPRVAWGAGKLVLGNDLGNLGGERVQVGLVGDSLGEGPPIWNPCAIGPGAWAGFPTMRSDGMFVFPQLQPDNPPEYLSFFKGTDPRLGTTITNVFPTTERGEDECTRNYGWAGFSAGDRLYLGALSDEDTFTVATDLDLAPPFQTASYDAPGPISSFWLAANSQRDGALVMFAVGSGCPDPADFYVVQVRLVNGNLAFENPSFVGHVDGVCRDYNGAALGPDGRAYVAVFDLGPNNQNCDTAANQYPLTVYVQVSGPTL